MRLTRDYFIRGFLCALTGMILAAPEAHQSQAAESRLSAPSESLFSTESTGGWSVGVHYALESRELKSGAELLELDADRLVAEFGYEITPYLQLGAQAGWIKAEMGDQDGENGLAWAAIARANLVEYVLRESPEVGRKEWLGLALDLQYRSSESNQADGDLSWGETYLLPSLYYFKNRRGDVHRKDYHANGFGLHGGLAFSFIDGDYGSADVEENRNFGFMVGGDARWGSGWIARLRATIYGSSDQVIELGTLFHF